MTEITSRKNKAVLEAVSLHDKKSRDEKGQFFTEGIKSFFEAESAGVMPRRVFVTQRFLSQNPRFAASSYEVIKVSDEVYDKISAEKAPEGIFAIFDKNDVNPETQEGAILLLEGVQDPGNVGTLLRCAVAFGIFEVVLVGTADAFGPKAVRSAMGAIFKIPVREFDSIDKAVEYVRPRTQKIIATTLSSDSIPLNEAETANAAIMIGNEGQGLSSRAIELSDCRVIIPIQNIESLNASVAGALCMYDSMMKRKSI